MTSATVRTILRMLGDTDGPDSGLPVDAVAVRAQCTIPQARRALTCMLGLEPAWIDGDVVPSRGLVWWLTPAGHAAALAARQVSASAPAHDLSTH